MMDLINRNAVLDAIPKDDTLLSFDVRRVICNTPKVEAIPVSVIREYIQKVIEEWNALGDRKYELPNMQVYNHVRKCMDDLERWVEDNA